MTEDDHEVKKNTAMTLTTQVTHVFEELIARYSTWTKLQRAFAWLLRFKLYCRRRYLRHTIQLNTGVLTVIEVRNATSVILENVKSAHFTDAITLSMNNKHVKKDCNLASLNPKLIDGLV